MADQNNKGKQQGQINIELDETTAQGIYSNLAIINHSQSEFVVDFVSVMPGVPKSKATAASVDSGINHFTYLTTGNTVGLQPRS